MSTHAIDLVAILVYGAVVLGFGLARSRRSESPGGEEYLLAGRRLTLPAFVATLVSTWYGGVLGVGEYSFSYGLSNWLALGAPYYLAGLIFAFLLAGRARRAHLVTVPERLHLDHGPVAGVMAACIVFLNMLPAAYLLMLGVIVDRLVGVGLEIAVVASAIVCVAAVGLRGFGAVVRTNALQFVLMYGGFLVLLPYAWSAAGGVAVFDALPATHLSWDGGLGFQAVAVWYLIAMQTLVEPTFYQRCYAARSPRVARRGVLVSVAFWIVFDALTTASGMLARVVLPDLDAPLEAYPALADAVLPPVLRAVFYVGLVATVMSTAESYLFVAATTLSVDARRAWHVWRRGAEARIEALGHARAWTATGLVLAALVSVLLALASGSAIELWKVVGSIVTPALLLPLLGGFVPALQASRKATIASMVLAPAVTLALLGAAGLGLSFAPRIEPIFPALAVSAALHAPSWIATMRRGRA